MTYCVAIRVDEGLVFASDSRTNAGADHISTYSKMFTFGCEGERAFVLLTAGNLATTQSVVATIKRDIRENAGVNLMTVASMTEAADYVGQMSTAQQQKHSTAVAGSSFDVSASFILGGQIAGRSHRVYMIYPEGNFIKATTENPYQQSGEIKYGKPILDRIITRATPLDEAALAALVSMDSTMRSNATVGPPIDVLIYQKDSFSMERHFILQTDDPYLLEIKSAWDEKIKEAFSELRRLTWNEPQHVSIDQ
ncbi:MAG: peptidase [Gammaproteobacteria bacterium]|nr:peptidase [Gammaproteobacteria bacterium]MDH3560148.1 peptidase [Gammaproteobacteria bacterium]